MATVFMTLTGRPANYGVRGMAFSPGDELYVVLSKGDTSAIDLLYTIDSSGVYSPVGSDGGETGISGLQSLAFDENGRLYGLATGGGVLCSIDTKTAVATPRPGPGIDSAVQGLEFDSAGRLFAVRDDLVEVVSLDPGIGSLIGPTGFTNIRGLAAVGAGGDDIDAVAIARSDLAAQPGSESPD